MSVKCLSKGWREGISFYNENEGGDNLKVCLFYITVYFYPILVMLNKYTLDPTRDDQLSDLLTYI